MPALEWGRRLRVILNMRLRGLERRVPGGDREDGRGEGLGRRVQEEVDFRFPSEFVTVV